MNEQQKQQIRLEINQKLVESGEKENIKEFLRLKLMESGWRDSLKQHCRTVLKERSAINANVTVEELSAQILPFAKSTVPDGIRSEVLAKVQHFIDTNLD